jgi:iron-sulfur cluster insertion protein
MPRTLSAFLPLATVAMSQNIDYIGYRMENAFLVSEAAQARVGKLLGGEPAGSRLRISVLGGGCSGFQYHFDFDANPLAPDDKLFGDINAPVVVDETSLSLISGSMLDYVESLGAAAFEIKNPNAKSSCGCGNSFSVAL